MFAPKDRRSLIAGLALALLASCASTWEKKPVLYGSPEALAQLQPGDIAIAPLRNQSGNQKLPWEDLRESFGTALLEGLYSPLDSEYVDGNWVESSFRGTPAPDALLVIAMHRWDTEELFVSGEIEAEAELFLFEGGTTTGTLLWGTTIKTELDMKDGRTTAPGPSPQLIPKATLRFARLALESLPARDPLAAHP